ncbi:hypothetical protein AKJ54_01185 [candidate division MSBL1 archaeon SCGC-AAA382K21]|uniref:Glycosyl transferase family 1 domain-containing protein n=1 Tax=candidate division MSBL1 archaeon SCGC-AAA382K21 TaxID=1698283 RepID=A0A133VJT5_9EURY|nr:hypothetical protein AKJ54_01185 [candidate division MSBL1 archaeon SCGC-AAA382K21]
MEEKILFVSPTDYSQAQGSTEAYYFSRKLAERYKLVAIGPLSKPIPNARNLSIPRLLPNILYYNIFLLPYLLYIGLKIRPSIVYTYKHVFLLPLLLKFLIDSTWIFDLQAPPRQKVQFNYLENKSKVEILHSILNDYFHVLFMRYCDLIITLSEELGELCQRRYRIDEKKIIVIPLGVKIEKFESTTAFNKVEKDGLELVYIGSITRFRGIDVCIRAMSHLPSDVLLRIIGSDSNEIKRLKNLSKAIGVYDRIIFQGGIPHNKVPTYLRNADVALSPLPNLKPFKVSSPAKIFEYLGAGLPIIATDILPHRKILEEQNDALFFHPDNPRMLADRIKRLYKDSELRKRMSNLARWKAVKNTWGTRFKKLEKVIRRIHQ